MKKIPTVFVRDPENMARVLDEVTPGCEWVFAGEGRATAKVDGVCTMFDNAAWWARREVKPGKPTPDDFVEVDYDPVTEKHTGWVPMAASSFVKFHNEALLRASVNGWVLEPGTYELCGPKINGNPLGLEEHELIRHGEHDIDDLIPSLQYDALQETLLGAYERHHGNEGVVWHHPDGRMAKLKARDFGAK